jgi:hypothetical protein
MFLPFLTFSLLSLAFGLQPLAFDIFYLPTGLVGDKYMSRSPFASSSSSDAVVGGGRSSFRQKQIKHNYLNEKSKKSKRKKVKMERSGESIVVRRI